MGYPMPGMQLHVVAGRGAAVGAPQYAQYARRQPDPRGFAYAPTEKQAVKFIERGVPEGAASAPQSDTIVSPTSVQQQHQGTQHSIQTSTSSVTSTAPSGSVFYAMNV